ncbi:MAG: glutamine--tRNA ligase, partial [Hydrogenophilales bacterium]
GFSKYKVKGNIHWVSKKYNKKIIVNMYDRLFISEKPGTTNKDFVEELNPNSLKQITCFAEKNIYDNTISTYQFERHGFFHIDDDSSEENLIFNRTVTLKDSWNKGI